VRSSQGFRRNIKVVLAVLWGLPWPEASVRLVLTRHTDVWAGYRPATIARLALGGEAMERYAITHDAISATSQFEEFSPAPVTIPVGAALLYQSPTRSTPATGLRARRCYPPATCARLALRTGVYALEALWTSFAVA